MTKIEQRLWSRVYASALKFWRRLGSRQEACAIMASREADDAVSKLRSRVEHGISTPDTNHTNPEKK